jgi:hypothetical protein
MIIFDRVPDNRRVSFLFVLFDVSLSTIGSSRRSEMTIKHVPTWMRQMSGSRAS